MKTLEVISGLEINTFNLANYHNLLLCINYLKGYDIVDTPTSYYFSIPSIICLCLYALYYYIKIKK